MMALAVVVLVTIALSCWSSSLLVAAGVKRKLESSAPRARGAGAAQLQAVRGRSTASLAHLSQEPILIKQARTACGCSSTTGPLVPIAILTDLAAAAALREIVAGVSRTYGARWTALVIPSGDGSIRVQRLAWRRPGPARAGVPAGSALTKSAPNGRLFAILTGCIPSCTLLKEHFSSVEEHSAGPLCAWEGGETLGRSRRLPWDGFSDSCSACASVRVRRCSSRRRRVARCARCCPDRRSVASCRPALPSSRGRAPTASRTAATAVAEPPAPVPYPAAAPVVEPEPEPEPSPSPWPA